jgi:hypothetical protein
MVLWSVNKIGNPAILKTFYEFVEMIQVFLGHAHRAKILKLARHATSGIRAHMRALEQQDACKQATHLSLTPI